MIWSSGSSSVVRDGLRLAMLKSDAFQVERTLGRGLAIFLVAHAIGPEQAIEEVAGGNIANAAEGPAAADIGSTTRNRIIIEDWINKNLLKIRICSITSLDENEAIPLCKTPITPQKFAGYEQTILSNPNVTRITID